MFKFRSALFLSIVFFYMPLKGMQQLPASVIERIDLDGAKSLDEFITKHQICDEVKKQIESHLSEIVQVPSFAKHIQNSMPEWLPDWVIKRDLNRIFGSLYIRKCSQVYNLPLVSAPLKFACTLPKESAEQELLKQSLCQLLIYKDMSPIKQEIALKLFDVLVIAQKMKQSQKPFNLPQIKQLYTMVKKSKFSDIKGDNIINTDEGIAYIIDTEEISFDDEQETPKWLKARKLAAYLKLDYAARDWISEKIDTLIAKNRKLAASTITKTVPAQTDQSALQ